MEDLQPVSLLYQHFKMYEVPDVSVAESNGVTTLIFAPLHTRPEWESLLQKLLVACNLNDTNSMVIRSHVALSKFRQVNKVLVFSGEEVHFPNMQMKVNVPLSFCGMDWLLIASLKDLYEIKEKKKETWNAIKQFFNIP